MRDVSGSSPDAPTETEDVGCEIFEGSPIGSGRDGCIARTKLDGEPPTGRKEKKHRPRKKIFVFEINIVMEIINYKRIKRGKRYQRQ